MIDIKNLSRIKELNVMHFDFDFRMGRNKIGNIHFNHYKVAYINSEFCYYIVANKQPLKEIKTKNINDSTDSLMKDIEERISRGYSNFNFYYSGSTEDAFVAFKSIENMINNHSKTLVNQRKHDRDTQEYMRCIKYISWYNKEYNL